MVKTELRGGHVFIKRIVKNVVSYAYIPRNQECEIEVRSLEKYGLPKFYISYDGKVISLKTNRIIKQTVSKTGYYIFSTYPNGRLSNAVCFKVHRLLAMEFVDNPDNKPFVNHKNGKKLCNLVSNLEWVTNHENAIHAHSSGLCNGYYTTYEVYDLVHKRVFEVRKRSEVMSLLKLKESTVCKLLTRFSNKGRYVIYSGYVIRIKSDSPWNLDNIDRRKVVRSFVAINKRTRELHHFDDLEQLTKFFDFDLMFDKNDVCDCDNWFIHTQ